MQGQEFSGMGCLKNIFSKGHKTSVPTPTPGPIHGLRGKEERIKELENMKTTMFFFFITIQYYNKGIYIEKHEDFVGFFKTFFYALFSIVIAFLSFPLLSLFLAYI